MTIVGEVDWPSARTALGDATSRVATLLRAGQDPTRSALGEWDVAQLGAHLSHAFDVVPALARQDRKSPLPDLWDLAAVTASLVADDPERDLGVLALRIETGAQGFLAATANMSATDPCPWLVEGTLMPVSMLTCHLLNEAVLHGWDIARATGQPWVIERAHAVLIVEGFLLHVFQGLDPRALVVQEKAAGKRLRYDIRLRGGSRFVFAFDDGALTVEAPSTRAVDCHLSVDPAAFLLVAWGRISQWQALPKGQLLAWGRRPWTGLQMRSMLRNP